MGLDRRPRNPVELEQRRLQLAGPDLLVARDPSLHLQPRRQAGVDYQLNLDVVGDLQGSEQRRVGRDSPVGLLDDGAATELAVVVDREAELDRADVADQCQLALPAEPAVVVGGLHSSRTELDVLPQQDFVVDGPLDVRLVVLAERLHSAGALSHSKRSGVCVEHDARLRAILCDLERCLPGGDVDQEIVPSLGRRPGAAGPDRKGPVPGSEPMDAWLGWRCAEPRTLR